MKKTVFTLLAALLFLLPLAAQNDKPYLSEEEVRSSVQLLPPPPAEGSIEFLMDKFAFWEYYRLRTTDPERAAQAVADADLSDVGVKFAEAFGLEVNPETMPETYLLLSRSRECFGSSGSNEAKRYYRRTRPFVYFESHTLTPNDEGWLRTNYSYPSGHTANYFGLAYILADLRPERTEALQRRAEQGGISRLIVGAHWASDVAAGKMVAASVYEFLKKNPEFQAQFRKAQVEVQCRLAGQLPHTELFNGKDLSGWKVVLKEGEKKKKPTFVADKGVLHISGQPFGYIRTEKPYSNYVLHLEWRWAGGEGVDGGIFHYLQGEDKVWPTGVQLQMTPKDMGTLMGGIPIDGIEGPFYRKARLTEDSPEKSVGEWNSMDFVCRDGVITAFMNGVLVNEACCDAREGYIGIQSEGGAMDVRNVWINLL